MLMQQTYRQEYAQNKNKKWKHNVQIFEEFHIKLSSERFNVLPAHYYIDLNIYMHISENWITYAWFCGILIRKC